MLKIRFNNVKPDSLTCNTVHKLSTKQLNSESHLMVYRLVTCNTYETEMFERATQKLGIDKAIFMSGTFK